MIAKMAGDIGDCVWALPCFRALGGGTLCLHAERWTREPMTEAKVQSLRSLLITQPYINDVRWLRPDESVDVNLNDFRAAYFRDFKKPDFPKQRNLCEWILRTHGCDPEEQHKQWLDVEPADFVGPYVVVNRTGAGRMAHHVYHNYGFPWKRIIKTYGEKIVFCGTPEEHERFMIDFGVIGSIHYIPTGNLLGLARLIAGAELFIGNQSCAYAIAEGLKKPAVLEVCPWLPNCLFNRSDVVHGWDADVDLPPVKSEEPETHTLGGQSVSGESVARSVLPS